RRMLNVELTNISKEIGRIGRSIGSGLNQSPQLESYLQFLLAALEIHQVFFAVLHEHLANLRHRKLFRGTSIDGCDGVLGLDSSLRCGTAVLYLVNHHHGKTFSFSGEVQSAHVYFEGFSKLSIGLEDHSQSRVIENYFEATKDVATD